MAEFPAIAHVAVTVTDVDASTEWYARLFGSEPVLHEMMTDTIRPRRVRARRDPAGTAWPPEQRPHGQLRRGSNRPGPYRVRVREPGRARDLAGAPRRAGDPSRRDRRRPLRIRAVLPGSRQHRTRVLRPAGLDPEARGHERREHDDSPGRGVVRYVVLRRPVCHHEYHADVAGIARLEPARSMARGNTGNDRAPPRCSRAQFPHGRFPRPAGPVR